MADDSVVSSLVVAGSTRLAREAILVSYDELTHRQDRTTLYYIYYLQTVAGQWQDRN